MADSKGALYAKTKAATHQGKGAESDQVDILAVDLLHGLIFSRVLFQVGWLKPECDYSPNTLIGNWNEKRFDVSLLSQAKPLPSQVCKS